MVYHIYKTQGEYEIKRKASFDGGKFYRTVYLSKEKRNGSGVWSLDYAFAKRYKTITAAENACKRIDKDARIIIDDWRTR